MHARLEAERQTALKKLRHCDLAVEDLNKAEAGPLTAKAVEKIRRQRRKVYDLHPSLLARMAEHRRLRERRQGLENSITKVKDSAEYRHDQREILRVFGGGIPSREDNSSSGRRLALLERDLVRTIAEVEIAATVQAEAVAKWQSEKATLDAWEGAIKAHSPAARRALAAIPKPGAPDDQGVRGYADIAVATPHGLHQEGKYFGRPQAVE